MSVIRKKYPIVDENGQSCTFPTFAGQVFGDGENPRALWQPGKGFYADDSARLGGADASAYALKTDAAPDSEKLGGNAPEYYMPDFGRGVRLWSGSWSGGSITVPGADGYLLYRIHMSGQGTRVLATRNDGYVRGIGGYSTAYPTITTYHFAATREGDVWTLVACNSLAHTPGGSHSAITSVVVTEIVGLL